MHGVTMSTKYTSNEKKLYSQLKELSRAYLPVEIARRSGDRSLERHANAPIEDQANLPTIRILKNRKP